MKISFREVTVDDAKMILDWRSSPAITQYMITDVPYDLEVQKQWIVNSYNRPDYCNWIIMCDTTPIGCIYIHDFDLKNARTSWGFYKGAKEFPGAGSKIPPFLFNWLFLHVGIKNIFTEVFYNNGKVLDLYLRFGHRFMPNKDRVIYKNEREILMVALEISYEDWDAEKYKDSITPFPASRWRYSPV